MKKIIFILLITIASLNAKPCMIDIYFGNGVWNTQKQGKEGMIALKRFMEYRAVSRLDVQKGGINYDFKHAYNPSEGTTNDLLETFYQLKESGQISNGYFQWIFTLLNRDESIEPYQKLQDIIRTYNEDAFYMFTKYDNESFKKKHNVLLVAHSQGNLFGNKMYTLMSDAQKKKFRMVSVATPANHVAGYVNGGPYVTATWDYVIRPIPGSLPSNIAGFGHTFIGTYLNIDGAGVPGDDSENAPKIIGLHVKSAYNNLLQTTSCPKYWSINMTLHSEGYMKVYGAEVYSNGYISNVSKYFLTVQFDTYPSIQLTNPSKRICSGAWLYWGSDDYEAIFGAVNIVESVSDEDYLRWMPGTMYSKSTLESRKRIHYTIMSKDFSSCIELTHDGELYDALKDVIEEE